MSDTPLTQVMIEILPDAWVELTMDYPSRRRLLAAVSPSQRFVDQHTDPPMLRIAHPTNPWCGRTEQGAL